MNWEGLTTKKELRDFLEGIEARLRDFGDSVKHFELFVVLRLCRLLAKRSARCEAHRPGCRQ